MNVFHALEGVVLCMCILGACAQPAGSPRRGRKITRIHSNELVIPLHHRQNAVDMRTGKAYASEDCGPGCPPPWIDIIHNLAGLNPNISEPVCAFSDVFKPCSVEGDICSRSPVIFECCPTRCMPAIKTCYNGKPSEFMCVPKSIQLLVADKKDSVNIGNPRQKQCI